MIMRVLDESLYLPTSKVTAISIKADVKTINSLSL